MIDLILKGGYNYVSAVHTEGNNLNQGCLMSHVLFQSNSNFLSSINLSLCIGSCSVRRRTRSTILLLDHLLTEQNPIHRLKLIEERKLELL